MYSSCYKLFLPNGAGFIKIKLIYPLKKIVKYWHLTNLSSLVLLFIKLLLTDAYDW